MRVEYLIIVFKSVCVCVCVCVRVCVCVCSLTDGRLFSQREIGSFNRFMYAVNAQLEKEEEGERREDKIGQDKIR